MTWFEALILGLLQGLTEFLPVSSSGHLELGGALFGLADPESFFTFNIMVHGATFLSVVVVFRHDILSLIRHVLRFRLDAESRFAWYLVLSAVPVGVVGLLFEARIEQLFEGRVLLVGFMLWITATLLLLTRFAPKGNKEITLKKALIIGLAQVAAILPGVSRSGTTISTALYLGVDRKQAVRFSFLMVLIPIFGANFLKILRMGGDAAATADVAPLIIGTLAAFVSGLIACRWMLSIVRRGKIEYFSVYCFLAGLVAILWALL